MRFALIAGLVTTLSVVAAEAQTPRAPRGYFDIALVGAQPTGDFGLIVDEGWGLELGGRYEFDPAGLLSVRGMGFINYGNETISMGFINYGNETLRFCSVYSCRVAMDLDTRNNILFLGFGPELAFRMGPLRPYGRVSLSIGYFVTTSGLSGSDDWSGHSYANTNNLDDLVFQRRGGN